MTNAKSLRVLAVEDTTADFDLLVRSLTRSGYQVDALRVDTAEAMRAALASRQWDIVFSDWSMPSFNAMDALSIVHQSGIDVPLLIVSGTVNEETAVEALRAGARDFLSKDRLARLGPAVERELREAVTRRERNKMREQLLIADRMASVGLVAAGIAHEINNPLAAVIANLDLALEDFDRLMLTLRDATPLDDLRQELVDAREAADHVHKIVRDLRVFSRNEPERTGPVDLCKVLDSTLRMLSNEIRHRARVVKEIEDVPAIRANEARIGQVFLNLLANAAQAIPEGRAAQNEIRVGLSMAGARVRVSIGDTGPGIPPAVMRTLFTPFVTTKPVGQGTGLGLSICHRLVTELQGEITVDTQVGVGTTFVVDLPVGKIDGPTVEIPKIVARPAARRGTVIVIDDELLIGTAIARILEREHDVFLFQRARDAIDQIVAGTRFDVIVSDLMMPDVTGMDLHDELTEFAPDQADAVVFLTGGAFSIRAREFLDRVPNQRIEKPFEPDRLRAIVNARIR